MSIRVALNHRTSYRYDRRIRLGAQTIRLRPAPHTRTRLVSYSQKVLPAEHFLNWQQDPQGNFLARVTVPEPTDHFEIEIDLLADLVTTNPFDFFLEPETERYPFVYTDAAQRRQLGSCLEVAPQGPLFDEFVAGLDRSDQPTVDFLVQVNQAVNERLDYLIRLETGLQTPEQTLEVGSGACRDFAWLLVHALRHCGLAARFASGYSIQLVPDVKPLDGPAGVAQDTVDLHAWAEVYLPGAGWIGLDATSGLLCGEGHIPLACAPDPESAAPISGLLEPAETEFEHGMSVTRVDEGPRPTRPFDEATWQDILAAGDRVDERLEAGDVRLTMGGEPTFVAADDLRGDEWNVDAVGPEKRRRSEELIGRLRDRFAPGALLHFGQGKWYPGESLPRWALSCIWRRDGEPIWNDPELMAPALPPEENAETQGDVEQAGADEARTERFGCALAENLGLDPDYVAPAFEDAAHYLKREQQLPLDVDPRDPVLDDPEERARLARVFTRGLSTAVGHVLPLERAWRSDGPGMVWRSGLWLLRGRHIVLAPGDSPVGLRLPIRSLSGGGGDPLLQEPVDPTVPVGALPTPGRRSQRVRRTESPIREQRWNEQELADDAPTLDDGVGSGEAVVRTAMAFEVRDGRLEVFLPPTRSAEDFLELLAAIEETAAELEEPVVLTGYPPPSDPRLEKIQVTPDPGVIEVNIQPTATWREAVDVTTALYEEARLTRLQAMKFLVDGREVGTGGGNHIVLGARHPTDSPFLRRPDLLRSLIGYWLNHPSLSYLFSSLFIGPTSQAPRVDEARHEAVRELEMAFAQIPEPGTEVPPWQIDRLLRDLLVDSSGNTHRTEICIDKLFSPDSSSGRLGLVELRSFEMTPHARMNVVQQLLLRALIVRLWEQPYTERLQRWGTRLHDEFVLPQVLWDDFESVLRDLRRHDLELPSKWFRPQFDFRFPLVGSFRYEGVEVELRRAIEPWHVLAEEPGGGGTVRYVDSSLERLEARVAGLDERRFEVACNGWRMPLLPTTSSAVLSAGVRFRAWHPARCLQPGIGVHAPLTFDLVDRQLGRSVAGATVYTGHPGGRNYDEPPVNALEAESRRQALFVAEGHTPGPMVARRLDHPAAQESARTLDLRWATVDGGSA